MNNFFVPPDLSLRPHIILLKTPVLCSVSCIRMPTMLSSRCTSLSQSRMKKDAELMGRIASSVMRATPDSAGSSRAPKRPSPASTPYRADAVFDDCVSWPVAKVASQLQRSVGCDRDAVNSLFQSFVVEKDLSRSAIACLDLSSIVKIFDDALTTAGLKTIGLHAAMFFFLSRMKSFI